MSARTYKDLAIWQEAHALSLEVYRLTGSFPPEEKFAMVSQMRRAAVSVPSNIAEGQGRGTTRDFTNFLFIARGSAQEMATFLILSRELEYVEARKATELESRYQGLSAGILRCVQSLTRSYSYNYKTINQNSKL